MHLVAQSVRWALAVLLVLALLVIVEGSFGHDGLLCEWGVSTGSTSDGCG